MAFPKKSDVDANYFALAQSMLDDRARARSGSRAVFGTHDTDAHRRDLRSTRARPASPQAEYEFHMLYGIQRGEQLRLARDGEHVRVLIAYGTYWFPWYMRRLAERPANVWFVVKSLLRLAAPRRESSRACDSRSSCSRCRSRRWFVFELRARFRIDRSWPAST